jgi:hypothetical protein
MILYLIRKKRHGVSAHEQRKNIRRVLSDILHLSGEGALYQKEK